MSETTIIRKIGNSLGMILDKTVLTKVYSLNPGDEIDIEYLLDEIVVRPKKKKVGS